MHLEIIMGIDIDIMNHDRWDGWKTPFLVTDS